MANIEPIDITIANGILNHFGIEYVEEKAPISQLLFDDIASIEKVIKLVK